MGFMHEQNCLTIKSEKVISRQSRLAQSVKFDLHSRQSARRQEIEDYVAKRYFISHQAKLSYFLPILLSMDCLARLDLEQPVSVLGLNPAANAELFIEHYLDQPIEQSVAQLMSQPVDREMVIEVGNLASTRRGVGLLQFVVTAAMLKKSGYRWMVFTATDEVERLINLLGFYPQHMGFADSARLGDDQSSWGAYYKNNPKLMVGDLDQAISIGNSNARVARIFDQFSGCIQSLSEELISYQKR